MYRKICHIIVLEAIFTSACLRASTGASTTFNRSQETSQDTSTETVHLDKDAALATCFSFNLEPDEYKIFPNKTVFVPVYNRTYEEKSYVLQDNFLTICAPSEVFEDEPVSSLFSLYLKYLTNIGLGVSMVFLLIHLVVFALVSDQQNLPGCNLASLCSSLFLSYLLLIMSQTNYVIENPIACIAVAVLTQFFFLASFLWMFVMAFEIFRSIRKATVNLRAAQKGFNVKKYACNSVVAWGTALVFTAAALIADNVDGVDGSFKPQFAVHCWFKMKDSLLVFFAGPVFTIICLNFTFFGISAYNLFSNRIKTDEDSHRSNLNKSNAIYFRLAVIMGATWITGALAPLVDVLWLWYLFAVLNTLQGFFIFIAFTCTAKVKKYFRLKLLGARRPSQQSLTPTFQSYCYFGSSIEKDLDKVVDNEDKSQHIDTIVIHL